MSYDKVKMKVLEMKESGKSAREISEIMNTKGVTTPSGLKFSAQKVFDIVYQNKNKSAYVKRAKKLLGNEETVRTEESTNVDIVNLLNSSKYNDRQKVEAVIALLR